MKVARLVNLKDERLGNWSAHHWELLMVHHLARQMDPHLVARTADCSDDQKEGHSG